MRPSLLVGAAASIDILDALKEAVGDEMDIQSINMYHNQDEYILSKAEYVDDQYVANRRVAVTSSQAATALLSSVLVEGDPFSRALPVRDWKHSDDRVRAAEEKRAKRAAKRLKQTRK